MAVTKKCGFPNKLIGELANALGENKYILANRLQVLQEEGKIEESDFKDLDTLKSKYQAVKVSEAPIPEEISVESLPEDFISPFEEAFRDPLERGNRINFITSLFGKYVTALIEREAADKDVPPRSINRLDFIRDYGPSRILEEMKASGIDPYTSEYDNFEAIIEAVQANHPEYNEAEVEDEARYIQDFYDKISRFYWDLISAARGRLRRSEGLKITDIESQEDVENNPKEHFGLDITTISGYESLTALARHFLSTIPMMDDQGVLYIDDLYQVRYLESDFTYAKIVELATGTKSSSELIDRLSENIPIYPWLRGVVDRLIDDNDLATTIFSNVSKAFMPFDVITQSKDTVTLNKNNSVRAFLGTVKKNLLSGFTINKDAVYNGSSKVDRTKVASLNKDLTEGMRGYTSSRATEYQDYLRDQKNMDTIVHLLTKGYNALGFPVLEGDIEYLIQANMDRINPLSKIWNPLQTLLSKVAKDKDIQDTSQLLQKYNKAFSDLADNFRFMEQSTENGIRIGNKSRFSYVLPSYISDMVEGIHTDYESYLNDHFRKYPFFFNAETGRYYNDWLNILAEPGRSHMRENFYYKNVLHNDKGKVYSEWTVADHIEVALSEFGSFVDKRKARPAYSSYMMPTMSDATTVLYMQAPRYDSDDIVTYQEKILSNLENVVYQEVIKINDINDRARRREAGEDIPFIKYYDGKPEFTFIPQLNYYREDGKNFLQRYKELQGDREALSDWIQGVLRPIVSREFEHFMEVLQDNGVFSDNVGKFKKSATGEAAFKKALATFSNAIRVVNPDLLNDPEIQRTLSDADKITITTPESEVTRVKTALDKIAENLDLDSSQLNFKSPLKEELNHFFWNDYLANIYLMQMLTTTPQFYGSDVKFYKRGKEWYAATRKMDQDVLPELKMAIVEDVESVVPDTYKDSMIALYNSLIADGKINSDIRDRLMESMQAINETDGEAFMTLDTYRNIMKSSSPELWTDRYESVYQKLTNKDQAPLTAEEATAIFQIIKPFVYTQIDMANGNKAPVMPLPYQNKNSIMVLIPSMVRNNPKLQGILDFMNEQNLDMVQFESAVKVGMEGRLKIEGGTSKEVSDNLRDQFVRDGKPRDGFLYRIDSRGFGIQQETPPHYLDAETNVAVQMKRITLSYMSPEDRQIVDELTIESVKDSYKDLERLYNEPRNLYSMIADSLREDNRSSLDTIKAVTPNLNGEIPIPLCNPLTDGVIAPRVIAPFKQISKQMIAGGALIQASSLGQNQLKIEGAESLEVKFREDGSIEYIECLMPATYKELIPALLGPDGSLDIDAVDDKGNPIVPEEMRRIIAFRIPSEGANSIIPLRIKGFLPVSAGGTIITNPIVFTLTGSDLDVDKLFFYKKAFKSTAEGMVEVTEGKQGRDNQYFDLIYKAITSREYSKDMLIFSNFEEQKRAARIVEILTNPSIEKKFKNLAILEKMSTKDLESLAERSSSDVGGIASFISNLNSAMRNMAGKNLIPMIANQSSNAVLLRDYPSAIHKNYHFSIDNQPFGQINFKNTYLSVKQYLAAVVDNAKDPVLGSLGANMDTINAIMAMVRSGFNPVQIGLLFNQPAFKGALSEYEKSGKKKPLTSFLIEYKNRLAKQMNVNLNTLDTSLTSGELVDSLTDLKKSDAKAYYKTQLKVLENLGRVFTIGDYLSDYVSVSRYDSASSAPSVSVESIYSESVRVENFYRRPKLINLPRLTMEVYSGQDALNSLKMEAFPVVKYIQAMYGLSYGGAISMLRNYYPQLNPYFSSIRNNIGIASVRKELSNREITNINRSIMEYLLSERAFPITDRARFADGTFERELVEISNSDPELRDNYLLKNLTKTRNGTIGLEDGGAINPIARERFTDAWRGLVMSDNPTYKKLGLDLLRYCAYTYGVKFAPNSFIHLAPLEAQLLLPGYVDSLKDIEANAYSDTAGFMPQFYLNNADSNNLVPVVSNPEQVLIATADETDSFMLNPVMLDSLSDDLKETFYPADGMAPGAFKVINDKSTDIYVKYKEVVRNDTVIPFYQKVKPIPVGQSIYAYGKTIEEFIELAGPVETVEERDPLANTETDALPETDTYEGFEFDDPVPFDIENLDGVEKTLSESGLEGLSDYDFDAIERVLEENLDSMPELDVCKNL